MTTNLAARFGSFIKSMSGFENIDTLLQGIHLESKHRADYLLWNRRIIVEQKALVVDPADKPQKFIDRLTAERGLYVAGRTSTDRILAAMPDGEELRSRLYLSVAKILDEKTAHADKQTRDTREIFSIPDAVGILVILNASAPTLTPDLIRYGLQISFQKTNPDGSLRYPHNNGVVVISEAHTVMGPDGRGMPCFAAISPHGRGKAVVNEFADATIRGWASFNGLPIVPPAVPFLTPES